MLCIGDMDCVSLDMRSRIGHTHWCVKRVWVEANGLGKGILADLGRVLACVRPFDRLRANGLGAILWRTWGEGWLA